MVTLISFHSTIQILVSLQVLCQSSYSIRFMRYKFECLIVFLEKYKDYLLCKLHIIILPVKTEVKIGASLFTSSVIDDHLNFLKSCSKVSEERK